MVSNPATFFINGSQTRKFTYEGGNTLYHWSPHDSGLSTSMESNVMFFADSVDHARDVLRRLFEFWIECNEQYIKSQQEYDKRNRVAVNDYHGLSSARAAEVRTLGRYLSVMDRMKLTPVPTNQFYKVSWASNDDLGVYEK